jgi:Protein of unknown function (DUF2586)
MSVPDATMQVVEGGGLPPPSNANVHVKVGYASGATANTLYGGYTSKKQLVADLVSGPVVEAAAFAIERGAKPVFVLASAASTAGSNSAVTKVGAGAGTITLSGVPVDAFDVKVRVVVGGAVATATVVISTDGGDTFGPETATAASMPLKATGSGAATGVTMALANAFTAGDVYSFTTVAPAPTSSDLGAALDALLASQLDFNFAHIVGSAATSSGQATIATAVGAKMDAFLAAHRFIFSLVEVGDDTDASLKTAFSALVHDRIVVAPSTHEITSAVASTSDRRSAAWSLAARIAKLGPGEDPARFRDGALTGVSKISRDERATPGLDDFRFSTLRTHVGQPGFYVNQALTFAPPGSDFKFLVARRVMDRACVVARAALLRYLNDNVELFATTGFINEAEAKAIDEEVTSKLESDLVSNKHASSVRFVCDRSDDLITLPELQGEIEIVPRGYIRSIKAKIGYKNPALSRNG